VVFCIGFAELHPGCVCMLVVLLGSLLGQNFLVILRWVW